MRKEDMEVTKRSYSIASPAEEAGRITITVERLDDGEVSPYLVDELRVGDKLELRGPIGGYFVWEAHMGGPLLLVAGGSGIVPLMAMTLVKATCTGCGATDSIGALAVYMHGIGTVIRCPSCDNVLIRIAHAKGRYWLDMRGVRVLQIGVEA